MSRLPLPEDPVQRSYDAGKDLNDPEEHAVVTIESRVVREEPVVTRRVSSNCFLGRERSQRCCHTGTLELLP
jgi:hypothetical protein